MRSGSTSLGFLDWKILVWGGAIALVHLMPMPRRMPFPFSLSFPLELSVALLYPPPVAAVIVFVGVDRSGGASRRASSAHGRLPARAARPVRARDEPRSSTGSPISHDRWFVVGSVVLATALIGYAISTMVVAEWQTLRYRHRLDHVLRAMHRGVMAEFLLSYLGLALFSCLVAIDDARRSVCGRSPCSSRRSPSRGRCCTGRIPWRSRPRSSPEKQRENEYQALHDHLTDLPNRLLFRRAS